MASQHKRTINPLITEKCGSNIFKGKWVLKLMSSLLLPLALGIFTVVITFHQQSAAKQQRAEDREAARLQREEDRNASILQRQQDQNLSKLIREQEKNLDEQRYKNGLFDTYIQEMAKLSEKYNGSIISAEVAATIARVKTLNIFRLLDASRNARVVRFLHEAKQLTDTSENSALDLSTASLTDIDFRHIAVDQTRLDDISLKGVFLFNATFIDIKMKYFDFSVNEFNSVNFAHSNVYNGTFERSQFKNINYMPHVCELVSFASTQIVNVNFSSANIYKTSFVGSSFVHINFAFTSLIGVEFTSSQFQYVNFSSSSFFNVSFSSTILENIDFSFAIFDNVNFSHAAIVNVIFSHARFINVDFSDTGIRDTSFSSAELFYPVFTTAQVHTTDFSSAIISKSYLACRIFLTHNVSLFRIRQFSFD